MVNDGQGKRDKEGRTGRGDFDILTMKAAPGVVFEKGASKGKGKSAGVGVGVGAEGGEEEVVEKTMLQKWVALPFPHLFFSSFFLFFFRVPALWF